MTAAATSAPATRRFVEQVMGMPISLALRGRHAADDRGRAAWDRVVAELRRVDRVFSTYRADSTVSRVDRHELTLEQCPAEVREVVRLGEEAAAESGGAFSVWLPADAADPGSRRRFDPSGVVKGWAAERAARELAALDDTDHCLSAGGDVVCRAVVGEPWRIGIEDPHDVSRVVAVVPLRSGAVATSGSARRGAHLVDARTGRSVDTWASVTVVAASLTRADIDATAAFALGPEAPGWLATRPIDVALLVAPDGRVEQVVPDRH